MLLVLLNVLETKGNFEWYVRELHKKYKRYFEKIWKRN